MTIINVNTNYGRIRRVCIDKPMNEITLLDIKEAVNLIENKLDLKIYSFEIDQDEVKKNQYDNYGVLNYFRDNIYSANVKKGFHDKSIDTGTLLMLIVSELSEALEADRIGKYADKDALRKCLSDIDNDKQQDFVELFSMSIKDSFEDEIADAIIRLFDLCGAYKINIAAHIKAKLYYNTTRPNKHGKNY